MIESKILGSAVGIQRGDVIDKSETTVLPSLANGVITGCFKRGRMDKPFKVTTANYQALLGHDPSNPSYLAVEDAFKLGVSEISVLRVGGVGGGVGGGGGAPIQCTPTMQDILFNPNFDTSPVGMVHAKYRVNGGAWVDYTNDLTTVGTSIIGDFFSAIQVDGQIAIEIYGNGGYNDPSEAAPFRSYRGGSSLAGASSSEPFLNGEWGLVEPKLTTIEFKVTQNNINDLVYLAFGKDTIAKSCASVIWEGL